MAIRILKGTKINGVDAPQGLLVMGLEPAAEAAFVQGGGAALVDAGTVSGGGNGGLGSQKEIANATFQGSVISPLSSTTGWTVNASPAGSAVTPTTLANGMAGLLYTLTAGAGTTYITNTAALAVNYAPDTVLGIWIEVSDPGRIPGLSILLSNDASFTNYRTVGIGGSGGSVFGSNYGASAGLYFIPFRCDAGAATGAPAASGTYTYIRIRVNNPYKNQGGTIKVAGLCVAPAGRPKIALTFDDGYASQYLSAFRMLSKYGIPATLAVTSSLVNGNGYCTTAQLQAMYAAGWDMVCHAVQHFGFNGSTSSGNFGKTTLCASQTPGGAGALTMNGTLENAAFDAPRHVTVWGGDQGVKVTLSGFAKDGVTPQSEDVYCWTGQYVVSKNLFMGPLTAAVDQVSGTAMSVGTSLSEAEMTTQITGPQAFLLANNMPRGAYDWVYPSGEFNATSQAILARLGFKRARIVGGQWTCPAAGDFRPLEMGGSGGAMTSGGSAAFITFIDDIINRGLTGLPYLHNFSPTVTDSTTSLDSDLQLVVDALAQRARDGKCVLVTQTQIAVA